MQGADFKSITPALSASVLLKGVRTRCETGELDSPTGFSRKKRDNSARLRARTPASAWVATAKLASPTGFESKDAPQPSPDTDEQSHASNDCESRPRRWRTMTDGVRRWFPHSSRTIARFDFCGALLSCPRWNCRTCPRCAVRGAPDQSAMPWSDYRNGARRYLRANRPAGPARRHSRGPRGGGDGARSSPTHCGGLAPRTGDHHRVWVPRSPRCLPARPEVVPARSMGPKRSLRLRW